MCTAILEGLLQANVVTKEQVVSPFLKRTHFGPRVHSQQKLAAFPAGHSLLTACR